MLVCVCVCHVKATSPSVFCVSYMCWILLWRWTTSCKAGPSSPLWLVEGSDSPEEVNETLAQVLIRKSTRIRFNKSRAWRIFFYFFVIHFCAGHWFYFPVWGVVEGVLFITTYLHQCQSCHRDSNVMMPQKRCMTHYLQKKKKKYSLPHLCLTFIYLLLWDVKKHLHKFKLTSTKPTSAAGVSAERWFITIVFLQRSTTASFFFFFAVAFALWS